MTKLLYYPVLLFVLLTSTGCQAETQVKQAWWLTIDLTPKATTLDKLPLGAFNSQWASASFLDNQLIKEQVTGDELQKFISSAFSFRKTMDLNGNGMDEVFRVGVYVDKNGVNGVFLAIYENEKLLKVLTDSSHNNFSVLLSSDRQLLWYKCMECGDYETGCLDGIVLFS